jgi:dTDP-glucose 4,6-dehydratase
VAAAGGGVSRRVLLTGSGGFFGAHVLRHLLMETDWEIVCPVTFRHKGNSGRIASSLQDRDEWHQRVRVIMHDLSAPFPVLGDRVGRCDYVIALAAESHVDRSIAEPVPFIRNNVDVALSILEYARQAAPSSVVMFSTDEVYGPMLDGVPHAEWSPILPSNPYAASKACQEAAAVSYWRTYGVPVAIVNSMNLIGEMQDPEKFLPKVIRAVLAGDSVPIHGVPGDIGSRFFIHARNAADALLYILTALPPPPLFPAASRPDRWNVVGEVRLTNLELAQMIAAAVGKPLAYELVDFHSARPGHDPHYGLDGARLAAAGWKPPMGFAESLERAVRWSLAHPQWLTT